MSNPLSGLKIDHWWHAFTVVGTAGMIATLAVKTEIIAKRDAFLLLPGLFLFGVGQWINHPLQTTIAGSYKITGYHRRTCPLGLCLECIGCAIIVGEIVRIAFSK
jgi:hypothetical protein